VILFEFKLEMSYFQDAGGKAYSIPGNVLQPSEQQIVDFYRQKDPSQTSASHSMLSTGRDRECIKVCVRVRPKLRHERS
jgi:hypothetical protein